MAESTVTQTGLRELRAAVEQFPGRATDAFKRVARDAAARVQARAKGYLASQARGYGSPGNADVAALIAVTEDAPNKQYLVRSQAPPARPANLPLWIEHGTIRQPARPYMRPAAKDEEARYTRDLQVTADAIARDVFQG